MSDTTTVSALRQRMIEDMAARLLNAATKRGYIRGCKRFAAFLKRSPETATPEDVRRFQLQLVDEGTSICTRNQTMVGLGFLFRATLRRPDLADAIYYMREQRKVPLVMSQATPILARVQSNGKHLLSLINTVLDISKIESGQFKLNLGEYALSSMVETVRVATESLAAAKKLVLKTEVARGLPYGLGDEQRLTQVLLNLVGNALKFTDQGEVRIAANAVNGNFALSVSDTGPGIPPDERSKIFDKFHQIDSSNTRTKGGTGLGLAIAKEIVEMHGGRIWVESIVGRGSTFRLELPVRAAAVGSGP